MDNDQGITVEEISKDDYDSEVTRIKVKQAFELTYDQQRTNELQKTQGNFIPEKISLAFTNDGGNEYVLTLEEAKAAFERAQGSDVDNSQYNGIPTKELQEALICNAHHDIA